MAKISLIAALAENRVIGNKGKLPWHIPEDMKRFKKLTKGHVIIMGRKTYESIGKPLPNRVNIIITRDPKSYLLRHPELVSGSDSGQDVRRPQARMTNVKVCSTIEEAIALAKSLSTNYSLLTTDNEIFIIGGGQIYEQAMKYADKLYLTIVKGNFAGDTFFPDYSEFKKVMYKKESQDKNYKYIFLDLER